MITRLNQECSTLNRQGRRKQTFPNGQDTLATGQQRVWDFSHVSRTLIICEQHW